MSTTEIVLMVLLYGALTATWITGTSLRRDRDDWMRSASSLARIVRGLDAWPVVERNGFVTVPIPPAVAVIGRPAALDRWSTTASRALAEYDALVDPEAGR